MAPRFTPTDISLRPVPIRALAAFLSLVLITAALVVVNLGPGAAPAQARLATGGSGLHKGLIDWFEWGSHGEAVGNNTTKSTTRDVDGQILTTTCTLSALSGLINAYKPGTWSGDGLDDLYNIGGTGASNQLIAGLTNRNDGALVSFDIACTVTLDGRAVPLPGLVVADAEASTGPNGEYLTMAPKTPATWRIIDRYRIASCETQVEANLAANGVLKLSPDGKECAGGPMAVAYMEGATSARVTMKGGGKSAVAVGVVLAVDYGDAPISYGPAGSIFASGWTGGTVPVGTTKVSKDFALGVPAQPALRLGALVDSDAGYPAAGNGLNDDTTGAKDEDGIVINSVSVTPGTSYRLPDVSCNGTGVVAGWLDWNRNGKFDDNERSAPVSCTAGKASLLWAQVPLDAVHSAGDTKTYLRLIIGADAAAVATPTGMATAGEVEDYAINVLMPQLRVTKTANSSVNSRPGDVVTYTVTATNTGTTPFNAAYPAVVSDDLTAVLDDATYNNNASATPVGTVSYTAPRVKWSGALAVGATMTMTYSVTIGSAGDGRVRNVAFAGSGATPACAPPNGSGQDPATGVPCAEHSFNLPRLLIDKSVSSVDLPAVGGTLQYTLTLTNLGSGDFTLAKPATMSDNLSDILDDGVLTASNASTGQLTIVGTNMSWSGALAAGATATITYTLRYDGTGNRTLSNSACVPVPLTAPGRASCSSTLVPAAVIDAKKAANPVSGTVVKPGQELRYTLTFTNKGTTRGLVEYRDDLSRVLDDATIDSGSVTATGGLAAVWDAGRQRLRINGFLPAGTVGTVSYTVKVKEAGFGDANLNNFLLEDGELPPAACAPGSARCTEHPVQGLWHLSKTAAPVTGTEVSPGDVITYSVTAKGQGGSVTGVTLRDTLTDVVDDATFVAGSATVRIDGGTPAPVPDPVGGVLTASSINLGINSTATLSYQVKVKPDAWTRTLRNIVTGTDGAGVPPASCAPCMTTHTTSAKVLLEKLGESSAGTWVRMPGSAWSVHADTNNAPGGLLDKLPVTEFSGTSGLFEIKAVPTGSYWLMETAAPEGFSLLAQPVKFTVAANGSVTLGQGAGSVVSVSQISDGVDAGRSMVSVRDVPAMQLPEAGGPGTWMFTVLGGGLLLLFVFMVRRSKQSSRNGEKP